MFYLYINEIKNRKSSNILKIIEQKCNIKFPKDLIILERITNYNINLLIRFNEPVDINQIKNKLKHIVGNYTIPANIENEKGLKKIVLKDKKDNEIYVYINNGKVVYIYTSIIEDKKLLKKILEVFNFYILILDDCDEEIEMIGQNKNLYTNKEFMLYLEMFDIYIGLLLHLIKNHMEAIKKYMKIKNITKITNKDIRIRNSLKNIFKQKSKTRWRSNRKIHILNISNLKTIDIDEIEIYNKSQNSKRKLMKYNNHFYNIKEIYVFRRDNLIKIRENYNRSNDVLYIIKENEKNNKYIAKLTKSVAKLDTNSLTKIDKYQFFNDIYNNDKK